MNKLAHFKLSENLARKLAKEIITEGPIEEVQYTKNIIGFRDPNRGFLRIRIVFDKDTSKINLYATHGTSDETIDFIAIITFELIDNLLAVRCSESVYNTHRAINESLLNFAKNFIDMEIKKAMDSFYSGNEVIEL